MTDTELYASSCIYVGIGSGSDFDIYVSFGDGYSTATEYQTNFYSRCFNHLYNGAGTYSVYVNVWNK